MSLYLTLVFYGFDQSIGRFGKFFNIAFNGIHDKVDVAQSLFDGLVKAIFYLKFGD